MLILTRFPGEMIRIGDNVIVKICYVDRNGVKIGIAAPKHVIVDREEIAERRRRNSEAVQGHASAATSGTGPPTRPVKKASVTQNVPHGASVAGRVGVPGRRFR